MAGRPQSRTKLAERDERIQELERQLAQALRSGAIPALDVIDVEPKQLNDLTRADLIADLLARSEQGETLDEIASDWNVEKDEIIQWGKVDVQFGRALRRALTRARAVMAKTLRHSMASGRGLPGSFIDRVQAMYAQGADEAQGAAAGLVHVHMRTSD